MGQTLSSRHRTKQWRHGLHWRFDRARMAHGLDRWRRAPRFPTYGCLRRGTEVCVVSLEVEPEVYQRAAASRPHRPSAAALPTSCPLGVPGGFRWADPHLGRAHRPRPGKEPLA
jgi:hypothetical protein